MRHYFQSNDCCGTFKESYNRVSGSAGADLITDAKEINADYAMFYWRAGTRSFVRRAHENGLKVVAGMVNSERGIRRLERIGVDAVVTDLSGLLRHKTEDR